MIKEVGIGVDLGGTAIKCGLVTTDGMVIWNTKKTAYANSSRKEIEQSVSDAVYECLENAKKIDVKVVSVGIGTPGLVRDKNIILGAAFNLSNWENVPLGTLIEEKVNLPTFIANDADMMGLGEYSSAGYKNETIVFLTLGTGIGGALFINGKLFQGHFGLGGELGVMPLVVNEDVINWEDIASITAMVNLYQKHCDPSVKDKINGEFITLRFNEGEALAVEVVNRIARNVALGVASFINILNPKRIVIGGGISDAGDFFIIKIKENIKQFALKECLENVSIERAKLGNTAGLIGAAIFGLNNVKRKATKL